MRKKAITVFILLTLISISYFLGESNTTSLLAYPENLYTKIKLFTSIIETIQRVYVEEKNPDDLINNAIKGVLSNLDPHTAYLPADDFKSWNQNFEGYSGIGISFEIINDKVTVMSVIASGPAAKKGIQPGDKIIAIEGETVQGLKKEEFSKKLMGPASTLVNIT
ncbi:MAG: S41 family peptidase, partial [bacterium]